MDELPNRLGASLAGDLSSRPVLPRADATRWTWTTRQRRVLAVGLLVATLWLGGRAVRHPVLIPDPPPSFPARYDALADRLDPNTAPPARLAVLPGIGPVKARAIVDYRESVAGVAFERPLDLTRVHGIGDATVAKLTPYLVLKSESRKDGP